MDSRFKKQILIALIFLAIIAVFVFLIYLIFKKPVLTPKIIEKPQLPEILFSRFFLVSGSSYDVLFRLKNPNVNFGASSVVYKIEFLNSANDLIVEKIGETYLWPLDERWVAVPQISVPSLPAKLKVIVVSANWEKLSDFIPPRISVFSGKYEEIKNNGVFAKATGRIKNGEVFTFEDIDIFAVAKDGLGNALSVNFTRIGKIEAGQEIPFEISWFRSFEGKVAKLDLEARTDIFQNELFLSSFKKD
ncbi:MAG: hypothetical protein HYV52_01815 [Parcubacteria group bacterium]|nr:hypothetical protein [Parcubacteria group bacterium]